MNKIPLYRLSFTRPVKEDVIKSAIKSMEFFLTTYLTFRSWFKPLNIAFVFLSYELSLRRPLYNRIKQCFVNNYSNKAKTTPCSAMFISAIQIKYLRAGFTNSLNRDPFSSKKEFVTLTSQTRKSDHCLLVKFVTLTSQTRKSDHCLLVKFKSCKFVFKCSIDKIYLIYCLKNINF